MMQGRRGLFGLRQQRANSAFDKRKAHLWEIDVLRRPAVRRSQRRKPAYRRMPGKSGPRRLRFGDFGLRQDDRASTNGLYHHAAYLSADIRSGKL